MAATEAATGTGAPPVRSVGQRRETLGDLAYKELLDAILLHRLPPGTPLGLDQLARQLGMSRTPVNLALSRLHAEGLVSYSEHLGFVVRVLTAWELNDIFGLRLMCELHAIATGLPHADTDQVQRIAEIQTQIATTTDWVDTEAFRRFYELDGHFHRQIVELAPNRLLQEWYGRLNYHLLGVRLALLAPQAGPFEAMLREHAAIVAALQARDVPSAQDEVRRHIERSRQVALQRLAASPAGESRETTAPTPA